MTEQSAVPEDQSATFAPPPAPGAPVQSYAVTSVRRVGKVRKPAGVWALSLVTLGIYYLYWWFKVNEELKAYDQRIEVQPALAALAAIVPVANLVTVVKTGGRIAKAQEASGTASRCSGGLGLVLSFLMATHIFYYQGQLNALWAQHGNQAPGTAV